MEDNHTRLTIHNGGQEPWQVNLGEDAILNT